MHDMLEEMGKTIVFQESPNDPGRRSRLWSLEDIDQVLRKNKGTEIVQGIVLKSSPSTLYKAYWDPEAFSKMGNLRLLIILCDLHLSLGLKYLSSSLKVLIWWGYPLNALPLGVQLDELVHLQMINSKVKHLWSENECFGKLKVIDLSNSKDLRQTPNISGVPNLEELYLNDCPKLVEVHQSIRKHKKLMILSLMGCVDLKTFPNELEMFSLKMLFLSDCSRIERLPEFGKNMTRITELILTNCKNLLCLPNSICNLKTLRILNISRCSKIRTLPDGINQNKALVDIDLSRTAIRELDPSLLQLENIKRLSLSGCSEPASNSSWEFQLPFGKKFRLFPAHTTALALPRFVSGLSSLTVLDLSHCNLTDDSIPHDIDCLSSLESLILSGNNFVHLPTHYLANLSKLRYLELEDCPQLQSLPVLPPHVRLYGTDSDVREAGALDPQKIWKLFESSDKELLQSYARQMFDFIYPMYFKIPPRFDNQNFFPLSSSYVSKHDSFASVTVDIPADCLSSDWWGVAVLVALEAEAPQDSEEGAKSFFMRSMRLWWKFDTLGPEDSPSLSLSAGSTAYSNLYLVTMVVSGDFIYIQRHRREDRRRFMHEEFSKHRKPEFKENSSLRFEVRVGGCKIRKCGWHMLCKEDYLEDLQMLNSGGLVGPSDSGHSAGMNKSSVDESKGKDITVLNVKNIERSNENFSLGKMFHTIKQGLGLSVLALISMMVGARIFLSPTHGLRFKKSTTTIETVSNKLLKSHWITSNDIVLKVNATQFQRGPCNRNVSPRFSFQPYHPPRRLSFSKSQFCCNLTK
ncbi:hypothetical protein KIW84_053186 [Lathyrus oleraceus]|uniref:Zer-1-like leucine-rich repeats region domain-containing protein n=1 Tax=Pisum sativum TaxID=3888 RepID=A0A9D4WSB6_PEA|nr:hypothetical protein KIW84_053186 [Pisum sativum]